VTARRRRPPEPVHGKSGKRKAHCHQRGDAGRWLAVVKDWPDLETGAKPDGAPGRLPGGKAPQKGEAA
jgi:hypothetical protein